MNKRFLFLVIVTLFLAGLPRLCHALPPGTLLYRTGAGGKMFGYSSDPLLEINHGVLQNLNAGHVGIYIGKINGEDYVVEALSDGIVKTPAKDFVNTADGEVFLGAKIPRAATPLERARAVALAESLADRRLSYDFDFQHQKGPGSGQWTCVGLAEKVYESAAAINPDDLASLVYDPASYAVDITPDGFDDVSRPDAAGDRFSRTEEFSQIARRAKMLVPAPELIGFDAGLEHGGQRYIFLPYTQFLQPTLAPVDVDISVASAFADADIRGSFSSTDLALRWSLVNNPLSAAANIIQDVKNLAVAVLQKIFGSDSGTSIVLNDEASSTTAATVSGTAATGQTAKKSKSPIAKSVHPAVVVHKNTAAAKAAATQSDADQAAPSVIKTSSSALKSKVRKDAVSAANSNPIIALADAPLSGAAAVSDPSPSPSVIVKTNSSQAASPADSDAADAPDLARINQIYATGANDWVELYNPTDHDFDLAEAGYRLEKAKTAEDPTLIMRLGNAVDGSYPGGTVIRAHGTYLIVRADADSYYKAKADALATRDEFNWSGSGYTLYLGLDAISSSTDPDIVDAVGFGPDATYFQGVGPSLAITDDYILNRVAANGDNLQDFDLIPAADPSIVWPTAGGNSASTDDGAAASAAPTTDTVTDSGSSDSEATSSSDDTADGQAAGASSTAPLILINQIYATGDNDWVELFNFGDQDFDLAAGGYRLAKTKTAQDPSLAARLGNTADGAYPGGTIIKAHDKYLIVRDDADTYYRNQADAIITRDEFGWTGTDYTMYLGDDAISSSTDPDILDTVGWGDGATYFSGSHPALAIPDGYILNRLGRSGNNSADFDLIRSDDPSLATSSADAGLFVPPTPIVSDGLADIFHFDECYGPGSWAVGRWDCAREIGYQTDSFTAPLAQAANLNDLTLSFYYKKYSDFPRLHLALSNSGGDQLDFTLDPGMITIAGLPNSQWRYFTDAPFDDDWHQAALVVNQAEDYWAVYIDGTEKVKETFFARLPLLTDLTASSDNGSSLVDEIAVWNRSLSQTELRSDYLLAAPFSPLAARPPQQAAQLKYLWQFSEDAGSVAQDDINQAALSVSPGAWVGRRHDDYALQVMDNDSFTADVDFPFTPQSRDISLAFWWRNSAYPNPGRIAVSLLGGDNHDQPLFGLGHDSYRSTFLFNGVAGILSSGIGQVTPDDDAWHHLALVYDSYRYALTLYADGQEKFSLPFIWIQDGQSVNRLRISSDNFSSEIDDLAIWQGALSPSQVEDIYHTTK